MTTFTVCDTCEKHPGRCRCKSPHLVDYVRLCNRCNQESDGICAHCRCPEFRLVRVNPRFIQKELF